MPMTANTVWLFVLATLFMTINGPTQMSYANGMGFKMKPTGLAFLVAAIAGIFTGTATPIAGQAAMLTVAGKNRNINERTAALIISSIGMIILGAFELISSAVAIAGAPVMLGMMAGVGLMLTEVGAATMLKSNTRTAGISILTALLIWGLTRNLVYTIASCVLIATLDYLFIQKRRVQVPNLESQTETPRFWTRDYWRTDDWSVVKPKLNLSAIIGGLSLLTLSIGLTSSFGTINSNIANVPANLDGLILATGLVNIPSLLFGGAPLVGIISGTAAAPWPIIGAILLMVILGLLLLLGVIIKMCKYIPYESIAGFLVVIGLFSTFIPNVTGAFATGYNGQAAIAMAVTFITKNPFLGLIAGLSTRIVGSFFGL